MDIKINMDTQVATILQDNKIVEAMELDKEEFRDTMKVLTGDSIDMVRKATKLFGLKVFLFKDVDVELLKGL
jgi:hypothetical protein